MQDAIQKLNSLVLFSHELLLKEFIADETFVRYKNECEEGFAYLISKNINYAITELAKQGLSFKVKKFNNRFLRWIYNFMSSRNSITFNAPYLNGDTELDFKKKYIFWTKMRLEGILLNLERLSL